MNKMFSLLSFLALFLASLLFTTSIFPCTVILVTKGASQNNSVIIAHTDDSNIEDDKRIVYVPAADYTSGEGIVRIGAS